jgi:hypothetical protein
MNIVNLILLYKINIFYFYLIMSQVCLSMDIIIFIIIFIILMLMMGYLILYNYIFNNLYSYKTQQPIIISTNNNDIEKDNFIQKRIELNNRDNKVLTDSFSPPERRLPEYQYPQAIKNSINVPTRGIPENYQLMGIASRNNTETIFNLFGRQTYPGSSIYEYYVQSTSIGSNYKIPITINGNKEISDGDKIKIKGTDESKGEFIINLYNYDAPRYNMFV